VTQYLRQPRAWWRSSWWWRIAGPRWSWAPSGPHLSRCRPPGMAGPQIFVTLGWHGTRLLVHTGGASLQPRGASPPRQ
jgi:hypothetical protein